MNINFWNNLIGYTVGDCVSGTVDIEIVQPFPAYNLVVSFIGEERVHLDTSQNAVLSELHRESREIANLSVVLAEFTNDTLLQPGQYTYAF